MIKVKISEDVNGQIKFGQISKIIIDVERQKIDFIYKNYLRTSLGDIELSDASQKSSPFSHTDGVAFKDKNGDIIPVRDSNGDIVMEDITDEEGNVIGTQPKPRLADYSKYYNVLAPTFKVDIAKSIFRVETVEIPETIIFLDE